AAAESMLRALADSGFSGVVLVGRDSTILWSGAYGRSVATGSSFWIASITKSFTAATILELARTHRLSLDDSLPRFFPHLPADKRAITIRELLTHSAGLGATYSGGGIAGRDQAVAAILAQPLIYPPGDGYQYGDDDFELLAAIVEIVIGRPWSQSVQHLILDPAGLAATGFWCPAPRTALRPVAGPEGRSAPCVPDDWGHKGANGMRSTALDLWRWSLALRGGGALDPATRTALLAPRRVVRHEGEDDIAIGYVGRIYVRGDTITEVRLSGSGDDGHTGIVRILPGGTTVIVLSNAGFHGRATWASWVAERLGPPRGAETSLRAR
ncbi:MAG TPA: serine hydrolase domain-containing protein, partial [Gemmatimonadales bacterium]|nr:serine hydrolase domain-containing protein [Gemmatimonadales bacterium]